MCQSARQDRQLVVETHSDHLLGRVRMDVRDGATTLQPEDVSILFFERNRLDVRIHGSHIVEHVKLANGGDDGGEFEVNSSAAMLRLELWVHEYLMQLGREVVWNLAAEVGSGYQGPLRIDGEGNILDAPDGYRQFFMCRGAERTAYSAVRRAGYHEGLTGRMTRPVLRGLGGATVHILYHLFEQGDTT